MVGLAMDCRRTERRWDHGPTLVLCAGIVSAVSFTSTSSRRDEVFGTLHV